MSNKPARIIFLVAILVVSVSSVLIGRAVTSSKTDPHNLTMDEVFEHGFYAYRLSDDFSENWQPRISIIGFDFLCWSSDNRWNPLSIEYRNAHADVIDIDIFYGGSPFFNEQAPLKVVGMDVYWIPTRTAKYYVDEWSQTKMEMIDTYGNVVTITSNLDIETVKRFVSQLNLVTNGKSRIINPRLHPCG